MNKLNIFKRTIIGLVAVIALMLTSTAAVSAIAYTGDTTPPSPVPAFNVFTGVPSVGTESDFFRARTVTDPNDSTTSYVDPLNMACTDGQTVQMRVYVHNGASQDLNNNGSGPSVAHGTTVKVDLKNANAQSTFTPSATISSANPVLSVTDSTTINCPNGTQVKLQYIPGSASQYSIGSGVLPLSDNIVTTGVPIQSEKVPGDVWGCWNERVYVLLEAKVVVQPKPVPSTGSCKAVDVTTDNNSRKVNVNVTGQVSNAQIVGYQIDFGDGTVVNQQTASHTYAKDGTYTIVTRVQVKFADGHTEWLTATACTKQVTFKNNIPVTPPVTPPATVLPNTGAGDVLGIFAATTVAGAFVHSFRRRLFNRG